MQTKKFGVIYLQKDRIQVYVPNTRSVVELHFPTEVIRDCDVIDKDSLVTLIKTFLATGKLPPADFLIVIADNASFIRDFSQPQPTQPQKPQQTQAAHLLFQANLPTLINTFVEHVPFENVASKTFPLKNGTRVFTTNRELYETIKMAFDKQGYFVTMVLPAFVFGSVLQNKLVLDVPSANAILQHANGLRQYDLLAMPVPSVHEVENEDSLEELHAKNNNRLYILIGVFILLIGVLLVVAIKNFSQPKTEQQNVTLVKSATLIKQPTPLPTALPTTAVTAQVGFATQDLTVSIEGSSSSAQLMQAIKTDLEQYTFKSVNVSQTAITAPGAIITFSASPSAAVRDVVIAEVKKFTQNVTVQNNPAAAVSITILLGQ